ncbi:MAG: HD domain-containing protein [Treponema sp.]|nr:HD domain-containing protein [Treponema sp.]
MFWIGQTLILLGFIFQICNLIIDIRFILYKKNSITEGKTHNRFLDLLILGMVCLFCVVYLIIFFKQIQSIWVGILLFAGACFVTTVLLWIYTLTKGIRESAFSISKTLIGIVEARDPNLNGHSLHVQELALLIYKYLPVGMHKGISAENLKYAALFHDVGKLGIPEAILNKPGKLNDEEWEQMRRHPEISVKILKPLSSFDFIRNWILYHHERMDGKGYLSIPKEQIPVAARIISVADTYSAITMARSYKPGRSYEEAIAIIKDVAGSQLDKEIVDIFCSIPKDEVEGCAIHL